MTKRSILISRLHAVQQRWSEVGASARAADERGRAGLDTVLYQALGMRSGGLADQRADVGSDIRGVSTLEGRDPVRQPRDEIALDGGLHEEALHRGADLPRLAEAGFCDVRGRAIEIGVFTDNGCRDAPQLQRNRA